jgi:hypothetical protein
VGKATHPMYPVLRLLLSALALNCLSTPYTTSPTPSTTAVLLPHLADRLRDGPLEPEDELCRIVDRGCNANIVDLASPGARRDSSDMSAGSTRGLLGPSSWRSVCMWILCRCETRDEVKPVDRS